MNLFCVWILMNLFLCLDLVKPVCVCVCVCVCGSDEPSMCLELVLER